MSGWWYYAVNHCVNVIELFIMLAANTLIVWVIADRYKYGQ